MRTGVVCVRVYVSVCVCVSMYTCSTYTCDHAHRTAPGVTVSLRTLRTLENSPSLNWSADKELMQTLPHRALDAQHSPTELRPFSCSFERWLGGHEI